MNRTKKIVKIILIVVASLIGTSVLFFAAMPYLSIFMGPWVHKKEMNNSIVNAGYPGWHEVTLDEHLQIKLPEAWTFVPGERITVTDENGEPVLDGVKIGWGSRVRTVDAGSVEQVQWKTGFFLSDGTCWLQQVFEFLSNNVDVAG